MCLLHPRRTPAYNVAFGIAVTSREPKVFFAVGNFHNLLRSHFQRPDWPLGLETDPVPDRASTAWPIWELGNQVDLTNRVVRE